MDDAPLIANLVKSTTFGNTKSRNFMVFKIRILSDNSQNDVEVLGDMNLYDFAKYLSTIFPNVDTEMTSFFLSNRDWDRLQEYTAIDMGFENDMDEEFSMPLPMSGKKVSDLIKKKFDRLIFVADPIMDSMFYLELMGCSREKESEAYPRIAQ